MSDTFGSLIDQLIIINIKIYNLIEITKNNSYSSEERLAAEENILLLNSRRRYLIDEIDHYVEDVLSGERIHIVWPRLKSYKDFIKPVKSIKPKRQHPDSDMSAEGLGWLNECLRCRGHMTEFINVVVADVKFIKKCG